MLRVTLIFLLCKQSYLYSLTFFNQPPTTIYYQPPAGSITINQLITESKVVEDVIAIGQSI
jgi:hypothetical protein